MKWVVQKKKQICLLICIIYTVCIEVKRRENVVSRKQTPAKQGQIQLFIHFKKRKKNLPYNTSHWHCSGSSYGLFGQALNSILSQSQINLKNSYKNKNIKNPVHNKMLTTVRQYMAVSCNLVPPNTVWEPLWWASVWGKIDLWQQQTDHQLLNLRYLLCMG